jgi:hypothetical protein
VEHFETDPEDESIDGELHAEIKETKTHKKWFAQKQEASAIKMQALHRGRQGMSSDFETNLVKCDYIS